MGERHLEITRELIDAWNANDWETIERYNHLEGEITPPPGWPEAGEFKGWQEVRAQFKRLKDPWATEEVEILQIEELRDGAVLTHVRWVGHGQASGISMDQELWNLYVFEGEVVVRTVFCFERDEAVRAVGS